MERNVEYQDIEKLISIKKYAWIWVYIFIFISRVPVPDNAVQW